VYVSPVNKKTLLVPTHRPSRAVRRGDQGRGEEAVTIETVTGEREECVVLNRLTPRNT